MAELDFECEWCGSTAEPEEVTGGWACSACHRLPPECTCYEHFGGHQPGCPYRRFLAHRQTKVAARPLGPNELEDIVLREAVLLIVTAPIWVAQILWRLVAGTLNDWRLRT